MYSSNCAGHFRSALTVLVLFLGAGILAAQPGGRIRGTVTLATNGEPVHPILRKSLITDVKSPNLLERVFYA